MPLHGRTRQAGRGLVVVIGAAATITPMVVWHVASNDVGRLIEAACQFLVVLAVLAHILRWRAVSRWLDRAGLGRDDPPAVSGTPGCRRSSAGSPTPSPCGTSSHDTPSPDSSTAPEPGRQDLPAPPSTNPTKGSTMRSSVPAETPGNDLPSNPPGPGNALPGDPPVAGQPLPGGEQPGNELPDNPAGPGNELPPTAPGVPDQGFDPNSPGNALPGDPDAEIDQSLPPGVEVVPPTEWPDNSLPPGISGGPEGPARRPGRWVFVPRDLTDRYTVKISLESK